MYKPDNQLQLVEKDLQEEIAKMLTANNPAAPKNTARFNMKERVYKLEPMVEQLLVHYATDGWLMHKASEDARKQQEVEKQVEEAAAKFQNEVLQSIPSPHSRGSTLAALCRLLMARCALVSHTSNGRLHMLAGQHLTTDTVSSKKWQYFQQTLQFVFHIFIFCKSG